MASGGCHASMSHEPPLPHTPGLTLVPNLCGPFLSRRHAMLPLMHMLNTACSAALQRTSKNMLPNPSFMCCKLFDLSRISAASCWQACTSTGFTRSLKDPRDRACDFLVSQSFSHANAFGCNMYQVDQASYACNPGNIVYWS